MKLTSLVLSLFVYPPTTLISVTPLSKSCNILCLISSFLSEIIKPSQKIYNCLRGLPKHLCDACLCYFWLFWAQAVMIFHQICGIVLPLDPEMAQTSTSSDIVRHKLPHMWEKSAQSITDDEQHLEIMIYICY